MFDIRNFTFDELKEAIAEQGHREFRARQLFKWLYEKCAAGFDEMTDISKSFRDELKAEYTIGRLKLVDTRGSADGTRKFLFETQNKDYIESVLIPIDGRIAACLSSQVGCAMDCKFCNTGDRGFDRNLETWEIIAQLVEMIKINGTKPNNIVFMGMGEPLANYENVVKAVKTLLHPLGFAYSPRKVTLSTAGLPDQIERLGKEAPVKLAVSLNATTDAVRDKIMPINKKFPINTLMNALRKYPLLKDEEVTIAYVLINGTNDSPEDARRLVSLLKGINSKVNLIVYNIWERSDYKTPPMERVLAFQQTLRDAGVMTFIRDSKGADIMAACGQLRGEYISSGLGDIPKLRV